MGLRTLWPEAKAQPAISLEEADHLARGDGVNLCIGGPYPLLLTGQQTRQHQATPLVDCPQDAGGQDFEWLRQDVGHHQVEAAALACRSGLNADSIANAVDLCIVRCGLKRQWVDVNGSDAHPLFVNLKKSAPGLLGSQGIKWNFTKFLLSADGTVIKRFAPTTKPEELTAEIEALLK